MRKRISNMRKYRKVRIWSNNCLRKYADAFGGDICNVSAANDEDKEGGKYRDYFRYVRNYYMTNWKGYRGINNFENEIYLDLEQDLPQELEKRFNVVFNHTTLEHIYYIEKAFANLCALAKDACIIVVPFLQEVHISESYEDYWRFTPYAIKKMFELNGFTLVICEHNEDFDTSIYLFCIAIRNDMLKDYTGFKPFIMNNTTPVGSWVGNDFNIFKYLQMCLLHGIIKQ